MEKEKKLLEWAKKGEATLYKRAVSGKIYSWTIVREGNKYKIVHGTLQGKKTESRWVVCQSKNTGKSNETTPTEQAISECASAIQKQMDKGYVEDPELVDDVTIFKPTLANKYKGTDSLKGEIYSQPKLDGIRCIVSVDGAFTRTGKEITSIPHILNTLEPFFSENPTVVLDGELYNHDLKNDFNKIVSIVRKQKHKSEDIELSKKYIQYHVYDYCLDSQMPFDVRQDMAFVLYNHLPNNVPLPKQYGFNYKHANKHSGCIKFVPTDKAIYDSSYTEQPSHIDKLYEGYIKDGYEGQMLRVASSKYEHKRSKNLLKRKDFLSEEFEILEVKEGKGNRSNMAGRVILKTKDGVEFGSGIKGGEVFYKDLWSKRESVVGEMATIVFQDYTTDGVPRFPVLHSIRDYE